MCGIFGMLGPPDRVRSVDLNEMLTCLHHRGPDDRGTFVDPPTSNSDDSTMCAFAHTRLAIIDLSSAGHQPMTTEDGRFTIVYNGEVYNYVSLKRELEDEGVVFNSNSDTEVILKLYARKGPRCLSLLRGMFAFAIYDRRDKGLFFARDPMGIKPLYLWRFPGGVAFASEIKTLRKIQGGPSVLDQKSIVDFLMWGSVRCPRTILADVESLPPATFGVWKGGTWSQQEYWHPPLTPPLYRHRAQALEALRPALKEAVTMCCISDAPMGAFLSGGIDSSSVVELMREAGQRDLRTFSISFPKTVLDESFYALKVAEKFETIHTDVSVSETLVWDELGTFFSAMDQPTCDGANTYLVSKFARSGGLTVSLSGLGADEVFGGYNLFRRIRRMAPFVSPLSSFVAEGLLREAGWLNHRALKLEALTLRSSSVEKLYYALRGLFMPSQIRRLRGGRPLDSEALDHPLGEDAPASGGNNGRSRDWVHTTMHLEIRRYLLNQLLKDSDVFGMAHSLEIRPPFLDHKLVELMFRIDGRLILAGHPKSLLLEALPSPLPRICTHRPKMGFTFPFDLWMKGPWKDRLSEYFRSVAPAVLAQAGLSLGGVLGLWDDYLRGRVHWSRPWSLYALLRYVETLS